jgi:hypothetical protein
MSLIRLRRSLQKRTARSLSTEKYGFAELFADFPVARSAWPAYMVC